MLPEPELIHPPASASRFRPRTRGNYTRTKRHVYAETHGIGLLLDIFAPESGAKGIALLDIVSGAWHSDRVRFDEHLGLGAIDVFCERGYHVVAIRPGSATRFTVWEMVEHVQAAQRHVLGHAEAYGVSGERYGVIGASAGGHLAALAMLTPRASRSLPPPAAMGLFFPPADLLDYGGRPFDFRRSIDMPLDRLLFAEGLQGKTAQELQAAAEEASPARNLQPEPPPVYLLHGDADPVVPLNQSENLAAALSAAGGEVAFFVKAGGAHPWRDIQPDIEAMADWFEEKLP